MGLSVVTEAEAGVLLQGVVGGELTAKETAAELIRLVVSAHHGCPRHVAVAQVRRLAGPARDLRVDLVEEACDELVDEGDILLAEGGRLFPSPLLIVDLGDDACRFVCSLSSPSLKAAVTGEWSRKGLRRECRVAGQIDEIAIKLGGIILDAVVWAGLDRSPCADGAWLRRLDARLKESPERRTDNRLDWIAFDREVDAVHWRRVPTGRLWKARNRWGGWSWAWTSGSSPGAGPFVSLQPDEGSRTVFALAREGLGPCVAVTEYGEWSDLVMPLWLPRAEYRFLSTLAERKEKWDEWRLPAERRARVEEVLRSRLGLKFSVMGATPLETNASVGVRSQVPGDKPTCESSLHEDLPVSALGRLPARVQNVLTRYRISTVGELTKWLGSEGAGDVPNVGQTTRALIAERLSALREAGSARLVFGCETPPADAASFWNAYCGHLEDVRTRSAFERYFRDRETLEAIGASQMQKVTRERIRQIIERNLDLDRAGWSEVAKTIVGPVVDFLESGVGIGPLDTCLKLVGATFLGQLELVAYLAEVRLTCPADGKGGIASLLSRDELERRRTELRQDVEERLELGGDYGNVVQVFREWGTRLTPAAESWLLTSFLGVELREGVVYSSRRRVQSLYVEALRTAGRSLKAQEVAELVAGNSPSVPVSARNVVAHFGRSPDVFSAGHGSWVHIENLKMARIDLEKIAVECLEKVPKSGEAVNVKNLVAGIGIRLPKEVSAHTVRDAMVHTGKVRAYRAGTDVAWLGGDVTRRNIADWLCTEAQSLVQPFELSELVSRVSRLSGAEMQSVTYQASRLAGNALLAIGDGKYLARDAVFGDETEFNRVREEVGSAVPCDDVLSAAKLAKASPNQRGLTSLYGPGVLWGIARTLNGMCSRFRGLLLWRHTTDEGAWKALRNGASYDLPPVIRPRDVADFLKRKHGIENDWMAYVLVQEALEGKQILSCGNGWYLDLAVPPDVLERAIDTTPEFERLVRGSQDFVRTSPARSWLNASRARRGLFLVSG